jgi:hypothetical protein
VKFILCPVARAPAYMGSGALILARDEVRVEMRLDKGSGWSLSGEVSRHEKIPLTEIGKSSEDRFPNSQGTARGSPAAVSVRGLKQLHWRTIWLRSARSTH